MTKEFYKSHLISSSKSQTWETPRWLFDKLNETYHFGLDAAALKESSLCEKYYGPDHENPNFRDAFQIDNWNDYAEDKTIWLNPPYKRNITAQWLEYANQQADLGANIMCLVPAATGSKWFQDFAFPNEVKFIKGKLKFGNATAQAPFYSALVYIDGSRPSKYLEINLQ